MVNTHLVLMLVLILSFLQDRNNRFSGSIMDRRTEGTKMSILCLHTRWDYQEMEKVMGEGEKTTYVTMLRDPVDVFESQWQYYNHEKMFNMSIGKN